MVAFCASDGNRMRGILYAFLAAVFYAINIPASKALLRFLPKRFEIGNNRNNWKNNF